MKRLRIILEVCGIVLFAVMLATGAGRSAVVDKLHVPVAPSYTRLNDPNYKMISALEDRLDALQKQLANLQRQYSAHVHGYSAPPCHSYENLATFKDELARGSTMMGVCLVDPTRINKSGTLTTSPTK